MSGWLKLHRKITESSIFTDTDLLRLWVLCLTKATHKGTVIIIDRKQIELSPGEFVTGRKSLTADYNQNLKPRFRKKDLSVWRDLKFLEECGNVNIKTTNKYSVVTVVKWNEYQESEQQLNNNRTTDEQQLNTNKNVKNVENEKKEKNLKNKTYTPEFDEFWNVYPRKIGKMECFKTWEKIIKQGEQPSLIIQCAENYAKDCLSKQTEDRFVKHPKTFLNDERYKDYKVILLGGVSSGHGSSSSGGIQQHTEPEQDWNKFVYRGPA